MTDETLPTSKSKLVVREEEIMHFWKKQRIFERSLEKKAPRGEFVFYDGPPFATGLPHYGHILAGTIKDVIPRFRTMQGYYVPRRWGWDCHGLPVETEVEKELGFKTKKDIENFGIEKFNAKAREVVMRYANDWRRIIPRLGRFVDMDTDYRTMDSAYTESVWWAFKTLHERGLIYEGWKSMHLCPRCETTLSNFEVTQNYKTLTDTSVFVKFPLLSRANTYLIAWTTTPWTLPGNAALCVHPEHDYAFVEITASNARDIQTGDVFIVGAKEEIMRRVFGEEGFEFDSETRTGTFNWNGERIAFSASKGLKGKELVGQAYRPVFGFYADNPKLPNRERGWRVYAGEFVTEEDGTGIVHIAPAFGEDDYQLAMKEKLPFIQHVATNGTMRAEVGELAGLFAKPKGNPAETDGRVSDMLKKAGLLLKHIPFRHEYPHCWRCDTPLLNYAARSWFVGVGTMREKLVAANKEVLWIPKDVGEFRFGNWLSEAKDWAISRSRFWGAPIPAWRCERCGALRVFGSLEELRRGSKEMLTACVFLRHAESEKNVKNIFDDSPDLFALTRAGRRKAKAAARLLETQGGADVIYASPVRRARETAEIVGAHLKKDVKIIEDLREVDSGAWDGRREDDPDIVKERSRRVQMSTEEYHRVKRGGTGESWEDVERRMGTALQTILARHKGERVLIVSHEGPIIFALKSIEHLTLAETDRFYEKDMLNGYAHPLAVYTDAKSGRAFDMHRPFSDRVLVHCDVCAKTTGSGDNLMRRVPEVFDCWFESGSMPFGQAHYPFDSQRLAHGKPFEPVARFLKKSRGYPADFIAEGLDQTRGWFYSLMVLGTALFGRASYKAVVVNGIVLAENGAKMSKRLRNYPDPLEMVGKYGADALRLYLLSSAVVRGEELRFSELGVDETAKKVLNRLDNVLAFFKLYEEGKTRKSSIFNLQFSKNILDKWIVARLNQLITEVTKALETYELDKAARPLGEFVDDLSTWYLRRSRERIKSDVSEEKEAALATLGAVLCELSKVMAPFTPFFAEYLFQSVNGQWATVNGSLESVHLEDWPSASKVDENLLKEMEAVRSIVSLALQARAEVNIKVRQPLHKLKVKSEKLKVSPELRALIQDEVNVKEIVTDSSIQNEVELDTALTPELKDEGSYRELARFVQEMRKKRGFTAGEFAVLSVVAAGASRRFIEQHEQELSRIASLKNIVITDSLTNADAFQVNEISLSLYLSKE